ncbi:FAD-dependent oxidoreductase [Ruania suaedae]|uniref:NAD(P)/FAD-dependent oxidoreductase n=1 Tax=Ruania suaedae TaxID=2897774 RepID=UPI001E6291ED|nr:FAD-dependent oxidoreductase [Ruania suaedae]UFU03881.1 FAD-dependent oxidoreductase [Ruania suaedae]
MTISPPDRVLVVGAGLAGLRTAAELRARGFDGHVRVLGAEQHLPYDRPPLSKELLSRPDPVWLAEDLSSDVHDLADDVRLGVHAARVSLSGRPYVETSEGERFEADAVVAATGSHAVRPWPAARTLHTLDDATSLRERLTPGSRLVIIGAGWIGAEVAGVAADAGCAVTVLEAGPSPLARQLGPELGSRTIAWYAEKGVDLRTRAVVTEVGDAVVRLADGGELEAGTVLSAVGARPSTAWLAGAIDLTASGHVPVDAAGRSAHPRLWAVGDVAERVHPVFGAVPGGHWSAALLDPARLAPAMLEVVDEGAADPAPYVYSTQLGHHLTVFGRLTGDLITRGDPVTGPWTTLAFEADRLTGAVITDAPREVAAVRKLLGRGELPRLNRALAVDPATPLKKTLAGS